MLDLVTIVGTGFLHQILPRSDSLETEVRRVMEPLRSWDALLQEVALRSDLLSAYSPTLSEHMPTLQWDELVRAAVFRAGCSKPAAKAESMLRSTVCDILRDASAAVTPDSDKLELFLKATGKHIVSLNFDDLLFRDRSSSYVKEESKSGVLGHVQHQQKTIWFPHGCIVQPKTIRLGQRDYGLLPVEWSGKVNRFKGFERKFRDQNSKAFTKRGLRELTSALSNLEKDAAQSLIGHLLLAPLVFFGVGLGPSEWGWWWLLNQRARNLARVPERDRPQTLIVLRRDDTRRDFWATRPAGLTPLYVGDWDSGWQVFLKCSELRRAQG